MGSRRWIALLLIVSLLGAACSGAPASSPAESHRPLPSLGPFGPSPEALAERDERIWSEGLAASGARSILGPALEAWVDEQRHAFVDSVLAEGGIAADGRLAAVGPAVVGPASLATLDRRVALGGAGLSLFLAGAFLREFSSPDGTSRDLSLPSSETSETTIDGRRATVQLTIALDFHFNGARIEGTVDITVVTTTYGADGRPAGTVTVQTKATVDMEVCPDIDGGLHAHFTTHNSVTTTGSAAGGSYTLEASGTATGQVGDDAFLHGMRVTGDSSQRSSSPGTRSVDAAVRVDVSTSLSTPGDLSSSTIDESSFREDVTRADENTTSDDVTRLDVEVLGTGIIIAGLLFEAAQKKWRNGYCIRIEATESDRLVAADEVVDFTAKVFHKFEGSELDQPIVASLSGIRSVSPLTEQDPPAAVTFTAGSAQGDVGTVNLETTSRRGIGRLAIRFEVGQDLVLRLEIESEIRITTALAIQGYAGTVKVSGYVDLEKDETTDRWSGTGDLTATTVSGPGGCNTVTVRGNGIAGANHYDWVVRESLIEQGSQAFDVYMDNGALTNETPDIMTLHSCPSGSVSGNTNTWENAFFIAHHKDYVLHGLHVVDWHIVATDQTWLNGGLVADTTWTDNCTGPAAAAQDPVVLDCIGTTYLWLRLVPRQAAPSVGP